MCCLEIDLLAKYKWILLKYGRISCTFTTVRCSITHDDIRQLYLKENQYARLSNMQSPSTNHTQAQASPGRQRFVRLFGSSPLLE